MKNLKEFIQEQYLINKDTIVDGVKINVNYNILKDGRHYHLVISKDYGLTGGNRMKGYLAQYLDDETDETLIGFTGKTFKDLEVKIKTWYRKEGIRFWNKPRTSSYFN